MSVAQFDAIAILEPRIKKRPPLSLNSIDGRWSEWTWQSSFWILTFACMVALNCQKASQNACYGCEKQLEPDPIFWGDRKISEAVCKRDWHNVRSYLFFNVRTFRTKISDSVCNGLRFFHSLYHQILILARQCLVLVTEKRFVDECFSF